MFTNAARSFGVPEGAKIPTTTNFRPCPSPSGSPCVVEMRSPSLTPISAATVDPNTDSKKPFSRLRRCMLRPWANS